MFGGSQVTRAFTLGDSANFSVLYEGGGVNHLNFNNGTITGNIGIGDPTGTNTAILAINGPATLNGDALFGGVTNYTINGVVTINGTISGNHTNVQGDLNYLNTLSTTLGAETGSNVTFNISNGATQTVNAASGAVDGNGNRVFTVTSVNFVNGATLKINGNGVDDVVFNINLNANFNGRILLTGGLTPDDVLFNILGGANLTGGHTLSISANGATETGTFLDPNGSMQINNSLLIGHFFGGDSHDDQIVSGAEIMIPEPSSVALAAAGVLLLGLFIRRRH